MRSWKNPFPIPGALTNCAPKATPFAKTSTTPSKNIRRRLRANEPELHEALGQLYLENHSDAEAQSELEKAVALDASRTHALYLLGRLYVQNRDDEKAVPYLQCALRLQPDLGGSQRDA